MRTLLFFRILGADLINREWEVPMPTQEESSIAGRMVEKVEDAFIYSIFGICDLVLTAFDLSVLGREYIQWGLLC